ncbi:MAG: EamA family transporter RarD [Verrucomicrobia bacterium]|nr:MAG: EamA family transporter RarD [Verrucomicrobiota bacterium]
MHTDKLKGGLAAATAFLMWGFLPLYWKHLVGVPPLEVIAHRWLWTALLLAAILAATGRLVTLRAEFGSPGAIASHAIRAVLLAGNWLTYVWAVFHDRLLEASLGYFLVPLVNVALGTIFLRERLNAAQWTAVAFAGIGVVLLATLAGGLPWVPLVIAFTFGFYGLLRKQATVGALSGATVEMIILLPIALIGLIVLEIKGAATFPHAGLSTDLLLMGTGIITAIPLVLFGYCSSRITLTSIGLFQYLAPTVKFILGLWVYHEPFSGLQLVSFVLIWIALIIYSWSGLWTQRRDPLPVLPE